MELKGFTLEHRFGCFGAMYSERFSVIGAMDSAEFSYLVPCVQGNSSGSFQSADTVLLLCRCFSVFRNVTDVGAVPTVVTDVWLGCVLSIVTFFTMAWVLALTYFAE